MKKPYKTSNDEVQECFELKCRKCGSTNVVLNYERESGYSDYTNWPAILTIGCNDCKKNDLYVNGD